MPTTTRAKPTPGPKLNSLPKLPNASARRTGIGCIGSGFIMADCHLVAYQQAGFNPVAIAARDADRARSVAAKRGVKKTYGSYQEMLDDPAVEVVDIAVPPDVQLDV